MSGTRLPQLVPPSAADIRSVEAVGDDWNFWIAPAFSDRFHVKETCCLNDACQPCATSGTRQLEKHHLK
jgi:hypothetical protein